MRFSLRQPLQESGKFLLKQNTLQWDELPEDYPKGNMTMGSKVVWELPNRTVNHHYY